LACADEEPFKEGVPVPVFEAAGGDKKTGVTPEAEEEPVGEGLKVWGEGAALALAAKVVAWLFEASPLSTIAERLGERSTEEGKFVGASLFKAVVEGPSSGKSAVLGKTSGAGSTFVAKKEGIGAAVGGIEEAGL
jgi:hypothetical protein